MLHVVNKRRFARQASLKSMDTADDPKTSPKKQKKAATWRACVKLFRVEMPRFSCRFQKPGLEGFTPHVEQSNMCVGQEF